MKLIVVVPCRNEEGGLGDVIAQLERDVGLVHHETILVNDYSTDGTVDVMVRLEGEFPSVRYIQNDNPPGPGNAFRCGVESSDGDCVAWFSGDGADWGSDLVRFYKRLQQGDVDCVFGDRWSAPNLVTGYPVLKQRMNRIGNWILRLVFPGYGDYTNIFKLYKRWVWDEINPRSEGFEIGLELSLSVVKQNYRFAVLDNRSTGRMSDQAKWRLWQITLPYLKTTWQILRA